MSNSLHNDGTDFIENDMNKEKLHQIDALRVTLDHCRQNEASLSEREEDTLMTDQANVALTRELQLVSAAKEEAEEKLRDLKELFVSEKLRLKQEYQDAIKAAVEKAHSDAEHNINNTIASSKFTSSPDDEAKNAKVDAYVKDLQESLEDMNKQLRLERERSSIELAAARSEIDSIREECDEIINLKEQEAITAMDSMRTQIKGLQSKLKNALMENTMKEQELAKLEQQIDDAENRLYESMTVSRELCDKLQNLQVKGNVFAELLTSKWVDSNSVKACNICGVEFGVLIRKHHCRMCGCVVCSTCSSHSIPLAHSATMSRVCNSCYNKHPFMCSTTS